MKKQKNHPPLILALPILALAVLGCGLSGILAETTSQSDPIPTRTPLPTFTPMASDAAFIPVQIQQDAPEQVAQPVEAAAPETTNNVPPTEIPTQVVQPSPVPADTATPDFASVTVVQNMNVRAGPGTAYPIIGGAAVGESSRISGRNSDSTWVQIQYPSATGNGWIFAPLVQINGDLGTIGLVEVAPPPPPPPTATSAPPPPPPPPAAPQFQFTPTGWHASGNPGIVHFKGRIKNEAGGLINGFSVLLDNWSWKVLAHPSGPSRHYPEKGPGEWDIVIPDPSTGVGWWTLTVVSYECPDFFVAFDAQCTQFTRRSEDVKIMVNWPDETVINADWTCHWDCNKNGGALYEELYLRP